MPSLERKASCGDSCRYRRNGRTVLCLQLFWTWLRKQKQVILPLLGPPEWMPNVISQLSSETSPQEELLYLTVSLPCSTAWRTRTCTP